MIEVKADEGGQPLALQWARYLYQVTQIANRWRVHTHWWREEIWREYFKVLIDSDFGATSASGSAEDTRLSSVEALTVEASIEPLNRAELLCTLYHDLLTDHWYLERVYD